MSLRSRRDSTDHRVSSKPKSKAKSTVVSKEEERIRDDVTVQTVAPVDVEVNLQY
jgi:hypothetical protein